MTSALPQPETSLWAGPRLIVPTRIDCLLVGTGNQDGQWGTVNLDYSTLNSASPFNSVSLSAEPPATGAYLHFTLPAALRHGTQDGEGALSFPQIPNRWLVTRLVTASATDNTAPTITAWIIESDYLNAPGAPVTWPVQSTTNEDTPYQVAGLGRCLPLSEWNGAEPASSATLTAAAPGAISWTASYSSTVNVLSLYDPLTDSQIPATATPGKPVAISYMVIGWYQPPSDDPLLCATTPDQTGFTSQADWQAVMTGFNWTVASGLSAAQQDWADWQDSHPQSGLSSLPAAQQTLPAQMLCHGLVLDLSWEGAETAYPIGLDTGSLDGFNLAFGRSPAESISSWLATAITSEAGETDLSTENLTNLLIAVFGDFVDAWQIAQKGSDAAFEVRAQADRFTPESGGTTYIVTPAAPTTANDPAGSNPPVPTDPQGTSLNLSLTAVETLAELNAKAATANQISARIDACNWQVQALTYQLTYGTLNPPSGPFGPFAFDATPYNDALSALSATLTTEQNSLADIQQDIANILKTLETGIGPAYEVTQVQNPPLLSPNAPSLTIAGPGINPAYATPAQALPSLETRMTGQELSGLTLQYTFSGSSDPTKATVSTAQILAALSIPAPATSGSVLPKEFPALLAEAILLDPACNPFLSKLFARATGLETLSASDQEAIATLIGDQQQAVYPSSAVDDPDHDAVAAAAGTFTGVAPAATCVQTGYGQPWLPLFVQWNATWYASGTTPADMLQGWQAEGNRYTYTGALPSKTDSGTLLGGTTLVSTAVAQGLASRLDAFLAASPQIDSSVISALTHAQTLLTTNDVMVQVLGGFESRFMGQIDIPTQLTSSDQTLQTALNDALGLVPVATPEAIFQPFRAGLITVESLKVYDTFGQIWSITVDGDANTTVSAAPSLQIDNAQFYLAAPPAFAQPIQLSIDLISATPVSLSSAPPAAVPTNSANLTSPIIGWLLPNRIDQSILIFDPDGTAKGSIRAVLTDAGSGLIWEPEPGRATPFGTLPQVTNAEFLTFLQTLLATGSTTGDTALQALIGLIDAGRWSVSAGPQPLNGVLPQMLGTPVAVVTAEVSLTRPGPNMLDPVTLKDGSSASQPDVDAVSLITTFGDAGLPGNGVVGYYVDGDYSTINAALNYDPALSGAMEQTVVSVLGRTAAASLSSYVVTEGGITLSPNAAPTKVTLLVDPRGGIPAICPALPVAWSHVPSAMISGPLETMLADFRTGPVLTPPTGISLPLPGGNGSAWSWSSLSGPDWQTTPGLVPSDPTPKLPSQPAMLRDGWLVLSDTFDSDTAGSDAS